MKVNINNNKMDRKTNATVNIPGEIPKKSNDIPAFLSFKYFNAYENSSIFKSLSVLLEILLTSENISSILWPLKFMPNLFVKF